MKDLEKLAAFLSDGFLKSLAQRGKYANGNERIIILRNAIYLKEPPGYSIDVGALLR